MHADEPIRTEASTVHRSPHEPAPAESAQPQSGADQEFAEAHTVIRGSSRGGREEDSWRSSDRSPAAVARVLLGQTLNHFSLEELIGGGGMGAVFRARDEQLDRTVAIKVIPFVGGDADLQRRFRNEAQSAAKLDHPHIARVFDVGSQGDWHYIVFEYVRGVNIRDKVTRDGVLSIDDAVFATCQLAEAIQHSADRGIVHRDIKPSNILVGEDDQIKLVDMGLARSDSLELSEDMTASGVTLGTFDYISPEQARNPRDADIRSDIYSLGCTLYFMLTGRPPYPGGTMLQKLLSHGNAPPPDARELRSEVSDDLMAVIHKMLAKSPKQRYQTARDLVVDLREIAAREGLKRSQAVAAVAIREPNRFWTWLERHTPWMAAASLLLLGTAWLQLDSASSHEEFANGIEAKAVDLARLQPPPRPLASDIESEDSLASAAVDRQLTDGSSAGRDQPTRQQPHPPETNGRSDENGGAPDGSAKAAADPPSLSGLVAPPELIDREEPPRLRALTPFDFPGRRPPFAGNDSSEVDVDVAESATVRAANSTDSPPIPLASPPRLIQVVGPDASTRPLEGEPHVMKARTLAAAISLADELQVDHIEIATEILYSESVEIHRDGLLITSAVGGSTIVFEHSTVLAMQRPRMMRIGPHSIEFQDLHFVWSLPAAELDGGSLFWLNANRGVRLTDCSITVENALRRDEVYAFDIVTDPEARARPQSDEAVVEDGALPLAAIELTNVIVRGEMTMIHLDYAAELQLQWDNGLLAVSRRMIETAGAMHRPAATAGAMQLSLSRLTAYTPLGLARMRLGVSGAFPVTIDRDARSSVFVVNHEAAHVEITGLESLDTESPLLEIRGEANAYDAQPTLADPLLVKSAQSGVSEVTTLYDLLTDPPVWSDEKLPRWVVRWSGDDLPNLPPSDMLPADFRQNGTVLSGFVEKSLPTLPRDAVDATSPADGPRGAEPLPAEDPEGL